MVDEELGHFIPTRTTMDYPVCSVVDTPNLGIYEASLDAVPPSKTSILFIWGFTSLSTLYRSYHDG